MEPWLLSWATPVFTLLFHIKMAAVWKGPRYIEEANRRARQVPNKQPSVLAWRSCALNFLHFKDKHDCFAWHPRAYTPLYACAVKHCSNLHPCTSLMSSRSPGIRSNYCIIRLRLFVWAKQSRPDYEFLLRFFCCCCFLFGVGDNFLALTSLSGWINM